MPLSVKKTAEKIVDSQEFSNGTREDKIRILIELCYVMFDTSRIRIVREYGRSKWLTSVHIKANLNNVEIPDLNFDIR